MLFLIFARQGRSRTRFKVGYINHVGNVIIDPKFDEGTNFYEGLASVKVGNRWGVINFAVDIIIQPSAWGWCRFHDGLASISVKGKWGVIDRRGEFVVTPRTSRCWRIFICSRDCSMTWKELYLRVVIAGLK